MQATQATQAISNAAPGRPETGAAAAAGSRVEWRRGGDVRQGNVWGPGPGGTLWVIPDGPDGTRKPVLIRARSRGRETRYEETRPGHAAGRAPGREPGTGRRDRRRLNGRPAVGRHSRREQQEVTR